MYGRRLKAALVLADRTAADLAQAVAGDLHIGLRTIERVMQGKRVPRPWETERFAEALGVPAWFLHEGLEGRPSDLRAADDGQLFRDLSDQLRERDERLERTLSQLRDQLARMAT